VSDPHRERVRAIKDRVERVGLDRHPFSDLYHHLLTISWGKLFVRLVGFYVLMNLVFAGLYSLDANAIENAQRGSIVDLFFFSVQTMATIGYGKMVPHTMYANALVTIEALVGMLSMAMATGLMFAKFSRPTARIVFSKVMVVSDRDGVPALALRVANERGNQVVEAQMRLAMLTTEFTKEGERVRRLLDLKLARPSTAVFALSWTAFHPITPDSPLYGQTLDSLTKGNVEFLVSMIGIDETFAQQVQARHTYFADEIVWNHRFVDIMQPLPDGKVRIDYTKFHDTQPVAAVRSAA
jgi:inward rectifier potassium channel